MACVAIGLASCKKEEAEIIGSGTLNFEFENVVDNASLELNTKTYTNASSEDFNISTFKYYVSNIELTDSKGSIYKVPENYFLIDQSEESSLKPMIEGIPAGDYTKISFTIGVDSARNFAGAQTDALDPLNGMFWTWNSGYIFVKLEGSSPASVATNNKLAFHIGGASATTNAIRKTSIDLAPYTLRIRTDKVPEVHIKVNVAKMFTGKQDISFATYNTMHGGANALLIANNYAEGMFSLDHIHN